MKANRLVLALVPLGLLLAWAALPSARAVPEGAEAVLAVRKLQELKKQLPTLITTWVKKRWGEERAGGTCRGELRAVRQTSLDRAKVSVLLSVLD